MAAGGRQRLVILGSGWGSYSVLRSLRRCGHEALVVSPRNHFLFTPLLCSTTVGTLEFRSIVEPVRESGFRQPGHFFLAEAEDVDFEEKTVRCRWSLGGEEFRLPYDRLVVGVGALTNTFGVPGAETHALFLKELADARRIRSRLLDCAELLQHAEGSRRDRLRHIVIVGGGPTGVEFGAELHDFVRTDLARLYSGAADFHVTLVESAQLLASFDSRLRSYAERTLRARANFRLRRGAVTDVRADGVALDDGSFLPAATVVWSAGLAPRRLTRALRTEKNSAGQIVTDQQLRIVGDPTASSFAIGDCADIRGHPLPCTAQVAERQGAFLARLLDGREPSDATFRFRSAGMLAYIGEFDALADTPGVKLHGFTSWLLWRSAYLTRLGSWRLRLQVPVDWFKALLFGRDTSRF